MVHVGKLTQLEALELSYGQSRALEVKNEVDDEGIRHLAGLTALTRLRFDNTKVTDVGLAALANMHRLEYLTISGHFTDAGLKQLHGLQSLRSLQLASSLITDEGVNSLSVHIPKLQSLNRFTFRP